MARFLCTLLSLTLVGCEPIPEPVVPPPPPTEPPSDAELLEARRYSVSVPAGYDADAGVEWPLLIALHGYAGSAEETVRYFDLERLAERRGLFLLAPNGLKDARGNRAWRAGPSSWPEWDRSWLTAVIRDLKSKYRIDRGRVIVFGHSQGAHMAHRMGCDGAEDVTAVISVAGQVAGVDCAPARPVSVLQIHGTADAVIGYYGDVQRVPPDPRVPSAHDTVATWARNDLCTGELEVAASSPIDVSLEGDTDQETVVEFYGGCPTGIDVGLWTMNGVPHRPAPTTDFSSRAVGFALGRPRP